MSADPDPVAADLAHHLGRAVRGRWSPSDREWFARIEKLRSDYLSPGATSISPKPLRLAHLARNASKRPRWARALYAVASAAPNRHALEYGTCIGISGAYIAAALSQGEDGHLWTMEGNEHFLRQAEHTFQTLGLAKVATLVHGRFEQEGPRILEEERPLGIVFKDGHHTGQATVAAFLSALPALADGALFVFDDITWSRDMNQAWQQIRRHEAVSFAVDLFNLGIVCLRPERRSTQPPPLFRIAIP